MRRKNVINRLRVGGEIRVPCLCKPKEQLLKGLDEKKKKGRLRRERQAVRHLKLKKKESRYRLRRVLAGKIQCSVHGERGRNASETLRKESRDKKGEKKPARGKGREKSYGSRGFRLPFGLGNSTSVLDGSREGKNLTKREKLKSGERSSPLPSGW